MQCLLAGHFLACCTRCPSSGTTSFSMARRTAASDPGKAMTMRLRGPGMKWDLDHAAGLMELKATYASGQAAAYWASAA